LTSSLPIPRSVAEVEVLLADTEVNPVVVVAPLLPLCMAGSPDHEIRVACLVQGRAGQGRLGSARAEAPPPFRGVDTPEGFVSVVRDRSLRRDVGDKAGSRSDEAAGCRLATSGDDVRHVSRGVKWCRG
jgi:hypothetical protein